MNITALHLYPTHVSAHYNLGIELRKKGDLEGAIPEFRTARRLNPNHVDARYNLAGALRAKGDLVSARKE